MIFRRVSAVTTGTRFDVVADGSRRINGVRNFRQALASPHSVVVPRFGAAHSGFGIRDLGFAVIRESAVEHRGSVTLRRIPNPESRIPNPESQFPRGTSWFTILDASPLRRWRRRSAR